MAGIMYPQSDYLNNAAAGIINHAGRVFANAYRSFRSKGLSGIRFRRIGKGRRRRLTAIAEIKYVDSTVASTPVPTGGFVNCFNLVAEGTDYNTRIGRTIWPKYMILDIIFAPPTTNSAADTGFWAIVQDKQPNNALANFTDIFSSASAGANKNVAVNSSRFKILRRGTLPILSDITIGGAHERVYVKLPLRIKMQYKDNTAAIPITNSLLMIIFSNNDTGASATSMSFSYNIRFAFCDV